MMTKKKKSKVNMKNVVWGVNTPEGKHIGGGNLDILRKLKKIPAICDKHQELFKELVECNDCNVRID